MGFNNLLNELWECQWEGVAGTEFDSSSFEYKPAAVLFSIFSSVAAAFVRSDNINRTNGGGFYPGEETVSC